MKLTDQERRNFAASFFPKKRATAMGEFYALFNHEIWRTCNSCGEEFDRRKTLNDECPKCGKK